MLAVSFDTTPPSSRNGQNPNLPAVDLGSDETATGQPNAALGAFAERPGTGSAEPELAQCILLAGLAQHVLPRAELSVAGYYPIKIGLGDSFEVRV